MNEINPDINRVDPVVEIEQLRQQVACLTEKLAHIRAGEDDFSLLKNNIIKNLNHEFRTPMMSILGFSEILFEMLRNPEELAIAEKIFDAGNRLMNTLNSVIVLAQLETGKDTIHRTILNVGDEVKEVVNQYKTLAQRKKLILLFYQRKVIFCELNKVLFQQAVSNLIDNAIKFTSNGTIKVEVSEIIEHAVPVAKIEVKDTGIGIPSEFVNVIFEDFRQVSEGNQRNYEGSGIGLSLSQRLIGLLDGHIQVKSIYGQGSNFIITLPALQILTPETEKKDAVHYFGRHHKLKKFSGGEDLIPSILLVEDNRVNTELIKHYLGHITRLVCTSDGLSAIEKARESVFDAILMDINLGPGIDGVETTRQIREIAGYDEVPVIAVTGYASDGDEEKFLTEGFSHYIAKPFTKDKIIDLLHDILY